jgi:glutamine amidotransferase
VNDRLGLVTVGGGNIGSVRHALRRIGVEPLDVVRPEDVAACDRLILPGVGAFSAVMARLRAAGLDAAIIDHVRRERPLLGICVGMQVLAEMGEEGGPTAGLGLIPGRVERLPAADVRLPHVGWNDVQPLGRDAAGVLGDDDARDFYFVHSYALVPDHDEDVRGRTDHGRLFASAVGRGPVFGVQFHPEKSQRAGLALLDRFRHLVA